MRNPGHARRRPGAATTRNPIAADRLEAGYLLCRFASPLQVCCGRFLLTLQKRRSSGSKSRRCLCISRSNASRCATSASRVHRRVIGGRLSVPGRSSLQLLPDQSFGSPAISVLSFCVRACASDHPERPVSWSRTVAGPGFPMRGTGLHEGSVNGPHRRRLSMRKARYVGGGWLRSSAYCRGDVSPSASGRASDGVVRSADSAADDPSAQRPRMGTAPADHPTGAAVLPTLLYGA